MTPRKELHPGQQFGKWTLVEEAPQRGTKRYWVCRCVCGNKKQVLQSSLVRGQSKSCGCSKEPRRIRDLTNQKFGRLTALEILPERKHKKTVWRCRCKCGNHIDVIGLYLTTGDTQSCGCLKRDQDKINFLEKYEEQRVDGVNKSLLIAKMREDNKSGVKGVCFHEKIGKWGAYIGVKGKQIRLGRYKHKEDAIAARRSAEELYHKPYLEGIVEPK